MTTSDSEQTARLLRRRRKFGGQRPGAPQHESPLAEFANIFDLTVVFAVGLLYVLLTSYGLKEFLSPDSEVLIVKQTKSGAAEVIVKRGKEIKLLRASGKELEGEGIRLGTAYMLKDGTTVYVPDEEGKETE